MSTFSKLQINLRQMILAIETAVSLVGMNDTNHGKRVGYIASQLGKQLGFSEQAIQFSFDLGLLHDCGVSTEQMHSQLVNHFDWSGAHKHCEIGYALLKDFEPLSTFAIPILYHHTPWEELKKLDVSPHDSRMANLIFLSDRIDVLAATHYETDILLAREDIVRSITQHEGTYFDRSIVSAFRQICKSEAFWIALENRHITRYAWDMGQFESSQSLNIVQLKQLSLIMAYIVDQKSPFTAQHSRRVASLARYLAVTIGLFSEQCEKIEIAGLLHDLGKLHIPDHILDKPGPLSDIERSIMNQHSYETYEILRHIKGLDEIACWAAFHHEGLNGIGYPFHPNKQDLSVEARIIAVADVFQALVQDRPYRDGMPLNKVIDILDELTSSGKLDQDIVNLIKKHGEECFEIAKGKE
ncbi:HD-GYP domain-containing protein [Photobacterium sp.]|uniref:HD-GYP domain-containing protein n=1 Tax=Photobacterium sp. TaxID=660 RepID=UPI00299D3494|nr:HD domain-containing phosphohydrolase [Photobacterium sp.]MDX1301291.1 HD domain-containing protein [Photobacterium sp.]